MPPVAHAHPESVIRTADGREVQLKVHQCVWSGEYPENSVPAILECYRERVARAEIDIAMLRDTDFLVVHDLNLAKATDGSGRVNEMDCLDSQKLHLTHEGRVTGERPPLLSEVVAAIAGEPFPTILELDLKDWDPWPWPRVEQLARLLQPIKDRITFGGVADWNLRRLLHVDPSLPMGFTITQYLDWVPETARPDPIPGVRGAYGYLDAHPLARRRYGPPADYLRDRLTSLLRLVPRVRDLHVRLLAVERMLDDGFQDLVELVHAQNALLDVWTLNADTPNWRERLERALAIGADVVTSSTPRQLARAYLAPD
ncbi:MAG TPA: glycerophosphodiester phosphodiesterase family protein [Chloroflexota bacterium]|jgi:glycerophosphoryl diester phosphodiesterase|nr:glycerophosphodiester phosphodiesterase family protein [Chloroflexota bacterium]